MSEINKELELYKLVTKDVSECGWVSDTEFNVWLGKFELFGFIEKITNVFGDYMFEDGGIEVRLMKDYICLDLTCLLCDEDIYFESVFPREEFKH